MRRIIGLTGGLMVAYMATATLVPTGDINGQTSKDGEIDFSQMADMASLSQSFYQAFSDPKKLVESLKNIPEIDSYANKVFAKMEETFGKQIPNIAETISKGVDDSENILFKATADFLKRLNSADRVLEEHMAVLTGYAQVVLYKLERTMQTTVLSQAMLSVGRLRAGGKIFEGFTDAELQETVFAGQMLAAGSQVSLPLKGRDYTIAEKKDDIIRLSALLANGEEVKEAVRGLSGESPNKEESVFTTYSGSTLFVLDRLIDEWRANASDFVATDSVVNKALTDLIPELNVMVADNSVEYNFSRNTKIAAFLKLLRKCENTTVEGDILGVILELIIETRIERTNGKEFESQLKQSGNVELLERIQIKGETSSDILANAEDGLAQFAAYEKTLTMDSDKALAEVARKVLINKVYSAVVAEHEKLLYSSEETSSDDFSRLCLAPWKQGTASNYKDDDFCLKTLYARSTILRLELLFAAPNKATNLGLLVDAAQKLQTTANFLDSGCFNSEDECTSLWAFDNAWTEAGRKYVNNRSTTFNGVELSELGLVEKSVQFAVSNMDTIAQNTIPKKVLSAVAAVGERYKEMFDQSSLTCQGLNTTVATSTNGDEADGMDEAEGIDENAAF